MPFPSSYKKALQNKTKNTTIRIGKELGKYKVGNAYEAGTYGQKKWNISLRIIEIKKVQIKDLRSRGISYKTVAKIMCNENLMDNDYAEIIKFEVL
jgi:hypothetical protein